MDWRNQPGDFGCPSGPESRHSGSVCGRSLAAVYGPLSPEYLDVMPKKDSEEQRQASRKIFHADTLQQTLESRQAFEELTGGENRFSKALETLDSGFMDA